MNEINKIYQTHVLHELKLVVDKENSLLNKDKVNLKLLAFLNELGKVSEASHCFSFWDHTDTDSKELLDCYIDGLQLLLSIGYELQITNLKNQQEINNQDTLIQQYLKVYQSILKIKDTYSFEDYQNSLDDYFTLGFKLGFSFDEILQNYKKHI